MIIRVFGAEGNGKGITMNHDKCMYYHFGGGIFLFLFPISESHWMISSWVQSCNCNVESHTRNTKLVFGFPYIRMKENIWPLQSAELLLLVVHCAERAQNFLPSFIPQKKLVKNPRCFLQTFFPRWQLCTLFMFWTFIKILGLFGYFIGFFHIFVKIYQIRFFLIGIYWNGSFHM